MKSIESIRTSIGEYTGEEFVNYLPTICQKLANDLNVLTFGIIIFDETTPEYRKLLRDSDYWDALDKSSGDKMVIFSLSDKIGRRYTQTLGFIIEAMSIDQDKGKSYSKLLKTVFNDEALLVYPSVLFFQVVDGEVYDYLLVPLKRENAFESTKSVQELFESVSSVLNNVLPEYYRNRREIFNLVTNQLSNQKYTMYILHGPKKLSELFEIIKNLFWL